MLVTKMAEGRINLTLSAGKPPYGGVKAEKYISYVKIDYGYTGLGRSFVPVEMRPLLVEYAGESYR
ncbi:MAG: hypothetical protein AB7S37_06390 [Methanobacteriales archaeon]|jgi:hypothetical protein|nr:hypothetical protein [Methanobacteriales archaeon]